MHKVPDEPADDAVGALVDLRRLDDLLLHGAELAPDAHDAGVLLPVRARHEAGVVRAEGGGEHARAPRPVHVVDLEALDALPDRLLDLADVADGDDGLLLARVGDLRDGRDRPVVRLLARLLDAAVVAVADGVDAAEAVLVGAPPLAVAGLHGQGLVHEDPAAAARALVAEGLRRHEVVRRLHADADVLLVGLVRQLDLVPERLLLRGVLAVVELLDADGRHVLGAVLGGALRERAKGVRQEVDDGDLELREEVLELGGPLHADEAGADDEDRGLLRVQRVELVVLLEDVAAAALDEALVDVLPVAVLAGLLVHGGEPQRLTHGLERAEVAAGADHAELEADLLRRGREHGLDGRGLLGAVQLLHLAPDELHADGALEHGLEREGQGVQVAGFHEGAEDAGSILEVLLRVDDRHEVVLPQVARGEVAGELASDDEDALLHGRHL
mmetsp:Transcript_25980/g.77399  ORF Transcript_25980/g.77399 Transcript_25980/m.77399 type:complete len:444 (+) Transcript_25980:429-1760(+)